MKRPMAKINACIHHVDKVGDIFIITYQYFEMTPENMV